MTTRTGPHWNLLDAALADRRAGAFEPAIAKLTVIVNDRQTSPELRERALYERAGAHRRLDHTSEAFADYDLLLARPILTPRLETSALYDRATTKIVAEDFAGAAADYTTLLGHADLDASAKVHTLINRGMAYMMAGDAARARTDFAAVTAMPDAPADQRRKAWLNLGEIYRAEHKYTDAIDAMTKGYDASAVEPGTADPNDVLAAIADLHIEANQLPQAIERLGELLARTDLTGAQRARALLRRAHAKAASGDPYAARVDARAVLRMRVIPPGDAEQARRFLE